MISKFFNLITFETLVCSSLQGSFSQACCQNLNKNALHLLALASFSMANLNEFWGDLNLCFYDDYGLCVSIKVIFTHKYMHLNIDM